ncbi:MAG: FkbM family methyltransferase [Bryobacteraceae bacterium]
MKRWIVRLCVALLIALVGGGAILALSPTARTKTFFSFYRNWHSHWPFAAGRQLPDHLSRFFTPFVPIWVHVEPGVTMRLDPYDYVTQAILLQRTWEPSTTQELLRHVPAGGTFVDVGAHVGWYTLKAAQVVGPKGHVIAVEPNRETLVQLRDNIRASGASAVVVVAPVACSDSETTLTLYATSRANTGESSLSSTNASQDTTIAASYPVRARRLDDIVKEAGAGRVNAIKIDVEGAEFLVLKGAAETLDRDKPIVATELIDRQLKAMGSSAAEVTAFMRSHGYTPAGMHEENTIFVPAAVQ